MLTWVEVDANAIRHNLRQFRKMIGKNRLLMPVIKANAYGHGFLEVARICDNSPQVDRICVVNDDEALCLANHKIRKIVQILTFYDLSDNEKALKLAKKSVIFPVFSLKQAKFLDKIGERARKKIKVHIKIDTGASRVGVLPSDALKFIEDINKFKHLEVEGIFSHFASSEDDRVYTGYQIKNFTDLLSRLKAGNHKIPLIHCACSSASVLYPAARFEGVRLGLSLYGLYPEELSRRRIKLRPALSWHTKIIQVRLLPPWTKIGYGGTFTTKKWTKIAVLPIGYWDGYDIRLSNNADVLIKGRRCPVRGRVCMNITMVEVPRNMRIEAGDKVSLIGLNQGKYISADELAKKCKTINYEIVDRINPLLKRVIKNS